MTKFWNISITFVKTKNIAGVVFMEAINLIQATRRSWWFIRSFETRDRYDCHNSKMCPWKVLIKGVLTRTLTDAEVGHR